MNIKNPLSVTSVNWRRYFVYAGFLIVVTVFAIFIQATIVGSETNLELLGPENWPTTVEETVRDLLPRVPLFERIR
jgi:hypothetical protein